MPNYENSLFDIISKYEPSKLNIVTQKNLGTKQKTETIQYDDLAELAKLSKIGKKTINMLLNVKSKTMGQAQADMMARALSKKLGENITADMLLRIIEDGE